MNKDPNNTGTPMTEVHGLPEPPEGCEAHVGILEHCKRYFNPRSSRWELASVDEDDPEVQYGIVARPKWEPKPGDNVRLNDGRQVMIQAPAVGVSGLFITTFHGDLRFTHRNEIVGPWVDPEPVAKPEPLQVGDRVKVLPTNCEHGGEIGVVSPFSDMHGSISVDFPNDEFHWKFSRCQLEKLPAEHKKPAIDPIENGDFVTLEEPATIDPGEGYRLIDIKSDVRQAGDEFRTADNPDEIWMSIVVGFGTTYNLEHNSALIYRRKIETAEQPLWTPPEWAKGLGWMGQDRNDLDNVYFFYTAPVFDDEDGVWVSRGGHWCMPLNLAKSLNLYPPHWDNMPASERCIDLSGDGA